MHTDDTALTAVLAEHLLRRGTHAPLDEDALAHEFARAWEREPSRGYGAGAAHVFRQINAGMPWREAAHALFDGQGSLGNGGAMRVAPVALAGTDLKHTAELARRAAGITHAHAHGQDGAALQACAAYGALDHDQGTGLDVPRFVRELGDILDAPAWREKLQQVAELAAARAGPERAAQELGHDISALGSVPTALLAFLINADWPADVVRYAIRAGGDTDTIAAMAGALGGARNGARALPAQWTERLDIADHLRRSLPIRGNGESSEEGARQVRYR